MGKLDELLSIDMVLDQRILHVEHNEKRLHDGLTSGRLIVIHDALETHFAERVHSALSRSTAWTMNEGGASHFHFRHHNLYDPAEFPAELLQCFHLFTSPCTRDIIARLSERDCTGEPVCSASWYMPGDYSLPHTDCTHEPRRQVAYVWHLTKDWAPEWGGHLFWGPTQQMIPPSFNTLFIFTVDPSRMHFVAPVSPYAQSKRLAVNGWWTGEGAYAGVRPTKPDTLDGVTII